MKEITVEELGEKITSSNPINIIDVREDEEVASGMIPSATHIKMGEIEDNLDYFKKDEEYYIVCAKGGRSANVVNYLENQGIDAVNVKGGMDAWGDEGLEYKRI